MSHWTYAEFAGALSRKVRSKELSRAQSKAALHLFESDLQNSFHVIHPGSNDFSIAVDLLMREDLNLRAGDALHIAIARNHDASMILALDDALITAAKKLHIAAQRI